MTPNALRIRRERVRVETTKLGARHRTFRAGAVRSYAVIRIPLVVAAWLAAMGIRRS